MFPLLSSMTADLCCWLLVRALRVLFLTSFPSLCYCTAPKSTLPLSSSWLLCSLFCTIVLLQCLCTCFSCSLWPDRSRTSFVTQKWIFILCLPRTPSAVASSPSVRLFIRMSISLSRMHWAANFPPTLAWNTSAVFGSFSFSNRMRGLFMKRMVFSVNLYLAVNLPIRGIPGYCPRQLVGVECVGKGVSVALWELKSPSSVVCLSDAKSSYWTVPA